MFAAPLHGDWRAGRRERRPDPGSRCRVSADPPTASSRTGELDRDLARIADVLAKLGQRLKLADGDGVDAALTTVADSRYELDRIERELVKLARQAGRSWAQIGADLDLIIPRQPDLDVASALRHARSRRSGNGASADGDRTS